MPSKVYELAKELKITNTEMVSALREMGLRNVSPSSDLDEATERQVRERLQARAAGANGTSAPRPAASPPAPGAATPADAGDGSIEVSGNVTVKELAEKLGVPPGDIQKVLMGMGVLAAVNQRLAPDAVLRIAQKLGRSVRTGGAAGASAPGGAVAPPRPAAPAPAPAPRAPVPQRPAGGGVGPGRTATVITRRGGAHGPATATRPPVVTVMGHVDHGKTTLLDAIRKTRVVEGEAGGITQHIGAYQVEADGKRITFLDTPGHAAFSAMRARGARVTDIVVLVVAADDGVMPQTVEAIEHARAAKVPLVVAVNKTDLPDANPDRVLTELTTHEIVPEAYGGTTPIVNISAKTGEGLPELLETILLVSEVEVDPKADPHAKAQGTVIEAKIDKGRGPVATVLVQQGTLRKGDAVAAGEHWGKIRTMTDDRGSEVKVAGPSTPVEIVGFNSVPRAGDRLEVCKDEREARSLAARRADRNREERLEGRTGTVSLEDLYRTLREGAVKELKVVIKGDVQGTVEAVREALEKLGNNEVRVRILAAGVGPISENDILLATPGDAEEDVEPGLIVGFNVGASPAAERKATQEHVPIQTYTVIYDLIDAVKAAMIDLLEPIYEEAVLGRAEVRARFRLPGGRAIAGCYVTDGLLRRGAKVRYFRGRDLLHTSDIDTLRRIKDDVREVQTGYECGLTIRDWNDIEEGDTIECFESREVPREL